MFGIGFTELLLVGVVALIVLGPERLPAAARTAGLIIGRLKRSFTSIREEVEREIGADEIRLQLRNEDILAKERKLLEETLTQTSNAGEKVNQFLSETSAAASKPVIPEQSAISQTPPLAEQATTGQPEASVQDRQSSPQ